MARRHRAQGGGVEPLLVCGIGRVEEVNQAFIKLPVGLWAGTAAHQAEDRVHAERDGDQNIAHFAWKDLPVANNRV